MKKIAVLILAAAALCSCAKSDKCKCTFKVGSLTLDNQIIANTEDKPCSQYKVEDINGDVVSIDLSKLGSVDCVNYND